MERRSRRKKRGPLGTATPITDSQGKNPVESAAVLPSCQSPVGPPIDSGLILPSSKSSTAVVSLQSSSSSRLLHSPRHHGRSPSPARLFREREQTDLQRLNTRLSSHADHVKQLQAENARLKMQLEAMDDVIRLETSNMKQLQSSEIRALKAKLDTSSEEKLRLASERDLSLREKEELMENLREKAEAVTSLTELVDSLRADSIQHKKILKEYDGMVESVSESQADVKRLNAELLKEKRINRRLEEEAQANRDTYLKGVEEANARFSQHIQRADEKFEAGYEKLVADALCSFRGQHLQELQSLRAELTETYQSKLAEWKSKSEQSHADLLSSRRDLKASAKEQEVLKDSLTQLKAEKAALQVQLAEAQSRQEEMKDSIQRDRSQAQREVALLSQELAEVKDELNQMGGVNQRLEEEINAYKFIMNDLEGQATSVDPKVVGGCKAPCADGSASRVEPLTSNRSRKKRKEAVIPVTQHSHQETPLQFFRTNDFSQGIEIVDFDVEGTYVSLLNSADHPVDLCLWTVQQEDGGGSVVKFEIRSQTQLARGKRLTIWSYGAGPGQHGDNDYHEDINDDYGKHGDDVDCCLSNGDSWLKLHQRITVRVEDGDGQLQAKCDFTALENAELEEVKKPRLEAPLSDFLAAPHILATEEQAGGLVGWMDVKDGNKSRKVSGDSQYIPHKCNRGILSYCTGQMDVRSKETPYDKDGCILM